MNIRRSDPGLKIIIVGAGKVGQTITETLTQEGHDIALIDNDPSKVREITNLYDILGVVGNGASLEIQREAGVDQADLLVAVTDSDELNLLCCIVASQFGKCSTIARVRTPDYSADASYLRDKLGLDMIFNPELESAKDMARILYLPTALEVNSFAHGLADMIRFKIPEGNRLDNMSIRDLGMTITNDILICGVDRDGEVTIPSGDFQLRSGDIISYVATRKESSRFLKEIGFKTRQVKSTMIVGGGRVTHYLADLLLKRGIEVKIIENDRERCEQLTELLPRAIIINGDGTNTELLKEEGISEVGSFVPMTGIDEENILLSLYAGKNSNAKVITRIKRSNFSEVIGNLDLGSVIYPKYITSEAIIKYVRAKTAGVGSNIETLYQIFDDRAEALEFRITEQSRVTDTELIDLRVKKGVLVACILRGGKLIIPSGHDFIKSGDNVVIVTTRKGFTSITDILEE
ncbi:MAG: Trk system potassium transporter TrkA [Clostridiales bacterium]|nr:Trk system potassium transporter TrkA [Clostridiales bacterium]